MAARAVLKENVCGCCLKPKTLKYLDHEYHVADCSKRKQEYLILQEVLTRHVITDTSRLVIEVCKLLFTLAGHASEDYKYCAVTLRLGRFSFFHLSHPTQSSIKHRE